MDELGLDGPAQGFEVTGGGVRALQVDPRSLGLAPAPLSALRGGDATENARRILAILGGEPGPARDVVVLNGAAAMVAANLAADMREGIDRGNAAIDSGAALQTLHRLVATSQAAA